MGQKKSPAHFAKQAQEAYELSIAGYSQRQIAEKMGVALATVQRRLNLYIQNTTMPKAQEYRVRQIARLELYIRSMWSQINMGDPKAVMAAVRTEERIAKLMGTDSATQYVVKADMATKESDALDVQKIMDHFFGRPESGEPATRRAIPGEVVRRTRPRKESQPITYAAPHDPDKEFATDNTFQPHEVQPEEVQLADTIEEFEPVKADPENFKGRRRRTPQNPASRFLVDSDD